LIENLGEKEKKGKFARFSGGQRKVKLVGIATFDIAIQVLWNICIQRVHKDKICYVFNSKCIKKHLFTLGNLFEVGGKGFIKRQY
jgi:hypothetical protein